jgi:hypothetical protein
MEKENEISVKEEKEVMNSSDMDLMAQMSADTEEYQDDTSVDDLQIPRIKILQALTPEVTKGNPKCVKGAEVGDLFNTLTEECFRGDKGFFFVPIKRRTVYLAWKSDRTLVKNYGEDDTAFRSAATNDKGKQVLPDGTEIVKTYESLGFIVDSENKISEAMISMSKTQIKKMKKFNTLIRSCIDKKTGKQYPEYAGMYKFTTVTESNELGTWFNYEVNFECLLSDERFQGAGAVIYNKAAELRKNWQEASFKVDYNEEEEIKTVSDKI